MWMCKIVKPSLTNIQKKIATSATFQEKLGLSDLRDRFYITESASCSTTSTDLQGPTELVQSQETATELEATFCMFSFEKN